VTDAELLRSFPQLVQEDIRAALAYAAIATLEYGVDWQPAGA
jgi:uncharacterized protein (DUF433 family)